MALINCPECNKEISDKAEACPHCGYPIQKVEVARPPEEREPAKIKTPQSSGADGCLLKGFLCVVGVFIAMIVIAEIFTKDYTGRSSSGTGQADSATELTGSDKQFLDKSITDLKSAGVIYKIDEQNHKVWINPAHWANQGVDEKKKLLKAFGLYCASHSTHKSDWVQVFDKFNDQLLGEITGFGSYKIVK